MLYYLFKYLDEAFNMPGASLFQYISFRAAMAIITSLLISLVFGKRLIHWLAKKQIAETVRNHKLPGDEAKSGTPSMGGLIIIAAIIIPVLLFTKLNNVYIQLLIFTTIWMGVIGFLDDYIKIFRKKKEGLKGRFKVIGQIGLGVVVGSVMLFHPDVEMREVHVVKDGQHSSLVSSQSIQSTKTTIPFFKNNSLDYAKLISWAGDKANTWAWLIYIPIIIFIITAVSNGANLTDGIDGLAGGTSSIIGAALGIFAWISGNIVFAHYLNIMYIPNIGELTIFISAFIGALVGFLWYNTYPAQVFMGDTGSLTIGAIIAVIAIVIRKELLLPILCGIFLAESLSVILQVSWFKYTKKQGKGRRIFLMTPLHHHFQRKTITGEVFPIGTKIPDHLIKYKEAKIVFRFLIIGFMLAIISMVTLKIR